MNHRFKLHPDGTLEITMPKDKKVSRVLVCEEGTQNGALYYPESDVPDTELIDWINECIADSHTTQIEKATLTAVKCKAEEIEEERGMK